MYDEIIQNYLDTQIQCINKIKQESIPTIIEICNILSKARDENKKVFVCGNGGSSSTASHFACDLLKTSLIKNTKKFKAISLSDNVPVVLAWANDISYDSIFAKQLENFLEKDDVVIAISGSGNSQNVLNAIEYANNVGANTISFTGRRGGKLAKIAKVNLIIPNDEMLTIETIHLLICHLLTTMIRNQGSPLFSY